MYVKIQTISPTHSDIALCVGANYQLDAETFLKKAYCLQCAIAGTTATFNVKLPVEIGIKKHRDVCDALDASGVFVIGIIFKNLVIKTYSYQNRCGYVGYAKDFTIIKEDDNYE